MQGNKGIHVISDFEDQPLIIYSHLDTYAIVTADAISHADELIETAFPKRYAHFSQMSEGKINQTQ